MPSQCSETVACSWASHGMAIHGFLALRDYLLYVWQGALPFCKTGRAYFLHLSGHDFLISQLLVCLWKARIEIMSFFSKPSLKVIDLLASLWRLRATIYIISFMDHNLSSMPWRIHAAWCFCNILSWLYLPYYSSYLVTKPLWFLIDEQIFYTSQNTCWILLPHLGFLAFVASS